MKVFRWVLNWFACIFETRIKNFNLKKKNWILQSPSHFSADIHLINQAY